MNVMLENLTGKPLWIRLKNGKAINISPANPPVEISKTEADNNPSIKKLLSLRALRYVTKESKSIGRKKPSSGEAKPKSVQELTAAEKAKEESKPLTASAEKPKK
jgi:hypothetical protein